MRRNNTHRTSRELLEVLQFFVLNHGCLHVRAEWFLSRGKLEPPPSESHAGPCGDKCPMCTGEWGDIFLPVSKNQVVRFIESDYFSRHVPLLASYDNIVDVLWNGETWRIEEIYGKKSVGKFNVDGLFLQLTAREMIQLRLLKQGLTWVFGRRPDPANKKETILNYQLPESWDGIKVR